MKTVALIATFLTVVSSAVAQEPIDENCNRTEPVPQSEPLTPTKMGKLPVFALGQASSGLSPRSFGLDGPHVLTYVTISSPNLKWTAKGKSRNWRFDQPNPSNSSLITIYLGGPAWHWKEQSRFVRADGKNVDDSDLLKLLEKPTPIVVSLTGNPMDQSFVRLLNSETIVLLLGSRDRELKPCVVDSVEAEQSYVPEPIAEPTSNGK
jgi:hypothetical protein